MIRKHFIFNDELWNGGFLYGCKFSDNKLIMTEKGRAVYISSSLNSEEKDTVWGRLKMQVDIEGDANISLYYISYNDSEIIINDSVVDIDEIIEDMSISPEEKIRIFESICKVKNKNVEDVILSDTSGQYLRIMLFMNSTGNSSISINSLDIQFPFDSIIKYLPSVFSESEKNSDFLKRFLGIYQALFYDLQENIDNMSKYFDADFVSGDYLEWLASWVGINFSYMWNEEKLRELIKNSFYYYSLKGTKKGLNEIITFYTKQKPIIVETYTIINTYSENVYKEYYESLYGNDIYSFHIFIEGTDVNYKDVEKLVELYKPAHTKAYIVFLDKYMVLGKHSYIGINSRLMGNAVPELGKGAILPFNSILIE